MSKLLPLYKLIILYMLERVSFPLTRSQISDFILEKEYTNFLTLQQVFSELQDSGFITSKTTHNRTQLFLTDEGRQTLHYFSGEISSPIKEDIEAYFREHELALRNEVSVLSDYYKSTSGEYEAHLTAKEKDIVLIDLTLSVPSPETAVSICDNWQKKNQEIYQYLTEQLF